MTAQLQPVPRARPAASNAALQRDLAHFNRRRMKPALPAADWEACVREEAEFKVREGAWIERGARRGRRPRGDGTA